VDLDGGKLWKPYCTLSEKIDFKMRVVSHILYTKWLECMQASHSLILNLDMLASLTLLSSMKVCSCVSWRGGLGIEKLGIKIYSPHLS
jgi:hypothetical protein